MFCSLPGGIVMPAIVKLQLTGAEQKVENAASIAIRMMMEDVHSIAPDL